MHVQYAEIDDLDLLTDRVQERIAHVQRTGIDT